MKIYSVPSQVFTFVHNFYQKGGYRCPGGGRGWWGVRTWGWAGLLAGGTGTLAAGAGGGAEALRQLWGSCCLSPWHPSRLCPREAFPLPLHPEVQGPSAASRALQQVILTRTVLSPHLKVESPLVTMARP